MSNLFVVAYNDLATANQVREKLLSMNREHLVELEDVVVERREKDGKIKLHQAVNHTATGAAGGAATDTGVNDAFMKEVSANLRPGAAALFVLVRQAARDKVVPELAQYGGQLVQTSLSKEDEDHIKEMAKAAQGA